jgi:predicted GNAT family N-acyltransferase
MRPEPLPYHVATTEEEFRQVGLLRRRAYARAGKVPASDDPFLDPLDQLPHSRVLYMTNEKGQMVATARVIQPRTLEDRVDHDQFFKWPAQLPDRRLCSEISRLSVEPGEQGAAHMVTMLSCGMLDTLRQGRHYFVGCAAGSLLKVYERVGSKRIGLRFKHALLGDIEHDVFVFDIREMIVGRSSMPAPFWGYFMHPLYEAASQEGLVRPSLTRRARLGLVRGAAALLPGRMVRPVVRKIMKVRGTAK